MLNAKFKTFGDALRYFRKNSQDPIKGGPISQERFAELIERKINKLFSRNDVGKWERKEGAIKQNDREILIAIIAVIMEHGGITTLVEADQFLELGNYRTLNESEIQAIANWTGIEFREDDSYIKSPITAPPNIRFDEIAPSHVGAFLPQGIIGELTKDFIGREYVFEAISKFTLAYPKGYFLIEGDPGVGKSALLAEYIRRTGNIAHFNLQSQGINNARIFLESICTQIIQHFELPYLPIPYDATQDGAFLSRILQEAAEKLSTEEKLILVVDALDEVDTQSQSAGSNILYLPQTMPENVYFILSSRPVPFQLSSLAKFERYDLMQRTAESRRDIESFLMNVSSRPRVKKWLSGKNLTTENFVTILAEKSQNNFMYLKYVVGDIEQGLYRDLEIKELPVGLEQYYENHWFRMGMNTRPLPKEKIKIIYILCEIRRPVSRALIADFAKEEEVNVQYVLDEWGQFLRMYSEEGRKIISLYHNSFRDFLHRKEIVQAAGVTIEGINALISDNLWDMWATDE